MRSALLFLALAALAASLGGPASAQRPIEWEPLPGFDPFDPNDAQVVGFVGGSPDRFEVLVGGVRPETFRWDEATRTWEETCSATHCSAGAIAVRDSVVMTGSLAGPGAGGALSLDGGRTWAFDVFDAPTGDNIAALLWSAHPDTDGSLLVGQSFRLFRSDDLGREGTYVELGLTGGQVEAIAEVPPSAALPGGRVLAGVWNGLSLSDDGGRTFRSSNVYQQGGIIGRSFAVHPDPAHPYGAVVYAAIALAEDPPFPALLRSDDGGATWAETARIEPGDFGVADPDDVALLATSDGALWVGVFDGIPGLSPDLGVVLRSVDGGRTLEAVDGGWGGYGPYMLAAAPDGRVYAATDSLVWRTVEPAVAVASAAESPAAPDLALAVEPNPSAHQTAVRWRQASAGAARVSVFDARGREVLVVSEGHRPSGEHRVEVDASGLAVGAYVVRVVTPGGTASGRLSVVR